MTKNCRSNKLTDLTTLGVIISTNPLILQTINVIISHEAAKFINPVIHGPFISLGITRFMGDVVRHFLAS